MKFHCIIVFSLLMFYTAQSSAKVKSVGSKNKVTKKKLCKKRSRTGSHLRSITECRSVRQKRQDREDARAVIEKQISYGANAIVPPSN